MNVVTLLPAATEMAYALGVEPAAVSHECDHPPAALDRPAATRSRVDGGASTGEINRQVSDATAEGGVFAVDGAVLDRAAPDLVVTQGTCDVCAVDAAAVTDALDRIDADPDLLTVDPHSLADVFDAIRRLGAATGRRERAAAVVDRLRERVRRVEETVAGADAAPRVAVLDWTDPVMVAGHWVPGMVESAGGRYGLAAPGEASRPREWSEVRRYDPEVLVVAPCGFGVDRTRENLADLRSRDGWADLTAVREGRASAVDGDRFLNRPGPWLVDSLEHLAALVHPKRFETPPPEVAAPLSALASERSA